MHGRLELWSIVAASLVFFSACSAPYPGDPAILEGVRSIRMLKVSQDSDPGGMTVRQVVDDTRVTVDYMGGPVCVDDTERQQPGVVTAVYEPDMVLIWIEPGTRGCHEDALAAPFVAAIEIELLEPIGERALSVGSRGDAYYDSSR